MWIKILTAVMLAVAASARPAKPLVHRSTSNTTTCARECMTTMVTDVLDSMVANDPFRLPLAEVYKATENAHPAALNMMTIWRTVTKAGSPNLLAIDTTQGQAYFALDITEGNGTAQSILWGRIKVVDKLLTEFELYVNRGRGEDGFAFDAANFHRTISSGCLHRKIESKRAGQS